MAHYKIIKQETIDKIGRKQLSKLLEILQAMQHLKVASPLEY